MLFVTEKANKQKQDGRKRHYNIEANKCSDKKTLRKERTESV